MVGHAYILVMLVGLLVGQLHPTMGAIVAIAGLILVLLWQRASARAFRNASPQEKEQMIKENSDYFDVL